MITIVQNLPELCCSKQPIWLHWKSDAPKARVTVQKLDGTPLDLSHNIQYYNGKASLDFQDSFAILKPPLPQDETLKPVVLVDMLGTMLYPTPYFDMIDSYQKFRVKIEDLTASDVLIETIYSNISTVIYGDKRNIAYHVTPTYNTRIHYGHDYPTGYDKQVCIAQPDYLFLMSADGLENAILSVSIFAENGTYHTINLVENLELPGGKLLAFPSGFNQLDIQKYVNAYFPIYTKVRSYLLTLSTEEVLGPHVGLSAPRIYVIAQKSYRMNYPSSDSVFLAVENGLGGIETAFFPSNQKSREASKRLFQTDDDDRNGSFHEYTSDICEKYQVRTSLLPRQDMEIWLRVVDAPIWLIEEYNFIRVYSETKTLSMPPIHQRRMQFQLNFKKYI